MRGLHWLGIWLLLTSTLVACVHTPSNSSKTLVARLEPGQDLRTELQNWAKRDGLKAASLVSAVGSLKFVTIRFADQATGKRIEGPLEIVGLSGMVAESGVHLHIAVADKRGQVLGGHLMEGSAVYTTAEIALLEAKDLSFSRELESKTGYPELVVRPRQ